MIGSPAPMRATLLLFVAALLAEPSAAMPSAPARARASAGPGTAAAQRDAADAEAGTTPESYLADIVALLRAEWPGNRTVNVACHGHSVPAGYFRTPLVDTFNAYPHLLHRGIQSRFPHAVVNIVVTAIGGEHAERGAARFAADVLAYRPDVVTIDYALNDRGLGLERARAAWSSMIDAALAHDIKVILLTPTPDQRASLDDPDDPLHQHAEQIRALARAYDVALVDSLARFQDAVAAGASLESLMSQVNHPNRRGHELVAGALLEWFPQ